MNLVYSTVLSFNNSRRRISYEIRPSFSDRFVFNNNVVKLVFEQIELSNSPIMVFDNSREKPRHKPAEVNYSEGIFPFLEKLEMLSDSTSTYTDFDNSIEFKDVFKIYEFNNNLPSTDTRIQVRVIPWGNNTAVIQTAINFPAYPLTLEVLIPNISKEYNLNFEGFYKQKETLNFPLTTEFNFPLFKYGLGLEMDQPRYTDRDTLFLETFAPKAAPRYRLSTELMVNVSRYKYLDGEHEVGYNNPLNMESNTVIVKSYPLTLESMLPMTRTPTLNVEFKNVYIDDFMVSTEFYIPNLYTLKSLSVENYVNSITKPLYTNVEFINIINGVELLHSEYFVPSITGNKHLGVESILAAPSDYSLGVEFAKSVESTSLFQTKIIPLGKSNSIFQVLIRATSKNPLDLETNITVLMNTELPVEFKMVIEAIDTINQEYFAEILNETSVDVETMVSLLSNNELNLETIVEIPIYELINLECFANFELKTALDIELWITDLEGVDLLNVEGFVSIEREFQLIAEAFVSTVNKPINLEFDILDLVYYFLRKGYNIIPWLYSEAKGKWDPSQQQNWDKSTDLTTVESGLFTQLQSKGYNIPECVNLTSSDQDGFGLVLPTKFTSTIVANQYLFFEHLGNDDTLVLGKKNIAQATTLSEGENLYIYQGTYDSKSVKSFDEYVRPHLVNPTCIMAWDPVSGIWRNLKEEDHDLYFYHVYEGKAHMIPYVFHITSDISTIPNS